MIKLKLISAKIEDRQYNAIKKLAYVWKVSFAEVLRRMIGQYIEGTKVK